MRAAADVTALDWASVAAQLDAYGCATTGPLLTPAQCAALAATYASDAPFRSRIVMARHGFGRGEYKYFAYPLPDLVAELRGRKHMHRRELRHQDAVASAIASCTITVLRPRRLAM